MRATVGFAEVGILTLRVFDEVRLVGFTFVTSYVEVASVVCIFVESIACDCDSDPGPDMIRLSPPITVLALVLDATRP